jgi:hypothetical protein
MAELETEEITCELIIKAALYIMEGRLPAGLIDLVNTYIDGVRDSAHDHSPALVGQIKQNPKSAQLQLDLRERVPSILAGVIAGIGTQYIKEQGHKALVTPIAMWSIHSYAGDYNPLHDHGGGTFLGLSSILYLKVPPVIAQKKDIPHGGAPNLHMGSGNCDGFTQLVWGATGMRDFTLFAPAHPAIHQAGSRKAGGLPELASASRGAVLRRRRTANAFVEYGREVQRTELVLRAPSRLAVHCNRFSAI